MLIAGLALAAWTSYAASSAWAQQRGPGRPPRAERQERGRAGRGGPPADRGPQARLGPFPGAHLFRPLPEDEGPVMPAERRQLMSFLRRRLPAFHRELRQLRQRDPQAFEARLEEAAPRLRQLQRIFERDPELGESVVRHAENLRDLERVRRAVASGKLEPEDLRRIHDWARRLVAENVRIEAAVLEDQALELEGLREARIEAEYQRLLSPDTDLAGEPAQVRELVERLRSLQEGDEIAALEDELRQVCAEREDQQVARLRRLAAKFRDDSVGEVDRRMQRLTEGLGLGGGPHGFMGPPHERGGRDGGGRGKDEPRRGRPGGP